ncbi:MAG: CPBP family glutamic-type intramembrane protease [Cucumibacter sp.]
MNVNQPSEIGKRIRLGRIGWRWIITLLVARFILAFVAQPLVALIFFRGAAGSWAEAGRFWTVYGTAIDLCCLALLLRATQREAIGIIDLVGISRRLLARDVLIGGGLTLVFLPLAGLGTLLASAVFYGGPAPASVGSLPGWALIYSLVVWPIIWAVAEQTVYAGYGLPRIEVMTGSGLAAVAIVVAYWSLQYVALPLDPDSRAVGTRFFGLVPMLVAAGIAYLRLRRLLPLIIAQAAVNIWLVVSMNFAAA